VTYIFIFT